NLGGPAEVAWGSFKRGRTLDRGEAIVDAVLAERLDLRPGDALAVPGRTLQIAGIARGIRARYAYIFITREDAALLLGLPERYNYALVETAPAAAAAQVAAAIN